MAAVWKRPGLTVMEVCWRWIVGVPLLWLNVRAGLHAVRAHPPDTAALDAMTVFEPMAAIQTAERQIAPMLPGLRHTAVWLVPLGLIAWAVASTLGRIAIWRQLDRSLIRSRTRSLPAWIGPVAALNSVRSLLLLGVLLLWLQGIATAGHYSLAGAAPNLVLLTAMVVGLTLLLFLLWCLLVWPLDAAPLFILASRQGVMQALRSAVQAPALRSKLVEMNLVMGIVKVGLAVLAMVFSATPLPFAAEETRGFLVGWWSFVGVCFLFALDFFHVVRRAAILSFFATLMRPTADRNKTREGPVDAS